MKRTDYYFQSEDKADASYRTMKALDYTVTLHYDYDQDMWIVSKFEELKEN